MLAVARLAKVELHRHLEGSLRLATVRDAALRHGLPEAGLTASELADKAQVLAPMGSLMEVLAAFDVFQRTFASIELVERIAYEAVEDAALDEVRLLELRFSPDFMTYSAGLDWDEAMAALLRGAQKAAQERDVAVGLIAICSRGYGMESAHKTADFALRWRNQLVGFDLADDEVRYPSRLFADAVRRVREAGLPVTIHSGESTGPDHVLETLEFLQPRRIGHGVAVGADAALAQRMREQQITIEACPTSNVRTRAVADFGVHPALRLLRAGVPVSLCSDDPGLFALTLSHELNEAQTKMGFEDKDLARAMRCGLQASFLPPSVVADVAARHFGWIDEVLGGD